MDTSFTIDRCQIRLGRRTLLTADTQPEPTAPATVEFASPFNTRLLLGQLKICDRRSVTLMWTDRPLLEWRYGNGTYVAAHYIVNDEGIQLHLRGGEHDGKVAVMPFPQEVCEQIDRWIDGLAQQH